MNKQDKRLLNQLDDNILWQAGRICKLIDMIEDIASFISVNPMDGATPEQLHARIKDELVRLTAECKKGKQ